MAVSKLPINNDFNDFKQSHTLDGGQYSLRFRYNKRNDTWYMTFLSDINQVLVGPKPCLSNVMQQTGRINPDAIPIGDIIFLDVSGNEVDCTQENFGDSINLFYQSVDGTF